MIVLCILPIGEWLRLLCSWMLFLVVWGGWRWTSTCPMHCPQRCSLLAVSINLIKSTHAHHHHVMPTYIHIQLVTKPYAYQEKWRMYTEGLLRPNSDTAMLFPPFGCIYNPLFPVSAHTKPTSRTLLDLSDITTHNYIHAIAFKAVWWVMQTLEFKGATTSSAWFWADSKSCRRISHLWLSWWENCFHMKSITQ